MPTKDDRHRVTRDELAQEFGVETPDVEEGCRRGDIPSIRNGSVIEVPIEYVEALREGRRTLPGYVLDPSLTGVAQVAETKEDK